MKKIALIGNPNTGKTSLFNVLCRSRQRVGNYPGVTVEKKQGRCNLPGDNFVEIVDLPGIYSLKPLSLDEQLTLDVLEGKLSGEDKPDALIVVIDSTRLQRNLFLFSQLAEMEMPTIVALTMADTLDSEGVSIDLKLLEEKLTVPVIPIHGPNEKQINELKEKLVSLMNQPQIPSIKVGFSEKLEAKSQQLIKESPEQNMSMFRAREILMSGLPGAKLSSKANELIKSWSSEAKDASEVPIVRHKWAQSVSQKVEKRNNQKKTLTSKIDSILTHPVAGLSAFFVTMGLLFQSIYTGAAPVMDALDIAFGATGDFARTALTGLPLMQSLVADGIIGGVGSVLIFLPQVVILFFIISLLEDSGYLARASFLMDRLLGWTGMSGRSFIPMISSFACAIPAILSTRVIPDARTRMITILVTPLISCSARLPVYILMIGTFIEPIYGAFWAGISLFAFHSLGILLTLPMAWLLNRGRIAANKTPFLLELPPYRLPLWRNVFWRTYEAAKKFTLKAGTIIFALSIIIWALSTFPLQENDPETGNRSAATIEESYLGQMGKGIQPIFAPLGFDWKISIGIVSAFPAREVIISTLGILYQAEDADEESQLLRQRMQSSKTADGSPTFTPAVAISLMIFFALCSQCMSTLAIVQKELNHVKWAVFLFAYMTGLAYVVSLVFYQTLGQTFS